MDVTSQGSGTESDISQQCVSGSRWHVWGGRGKGRRVTVRARPSWGGRGIRGRRCVSTRLSSRKGHGRPSNSGSSSSSSTTHLSAATVAVLNEIGSLVWKNKEPQSYTQQYTQTPGPTSPDVTGDSTPGPTSSDVTGDSTPVELFFRFFSDDVWDLIKEETNRYAGTFITNKINSSLVVSLQDVVVLVVHDLLSIFS